MAPSPTKLACNDVSRQKVLRLKPFPGRRAGEKPISVSLQHGSSLGLSNGVSSPQGVCWPNLLLPSFLVTHETCVPDWWEMERGA